MKKTIRSIKALLASGLMLTGLMGSAQTIYYPFPQNTNYSFGYKPQATETAMQQATQAAYANWKSGYLVDGPTCANTNGATKRVEFDAVSGRFGITGDNSIATVSEGIAYGMLMSAYYGEKTNFDGLWNYYKKFVNSNGIMNWGVNNTSCTIIGQNGATDAELDVAWALYVASWQFDGASQSSTYLAGAKALIGAIKKSEIEASTFILKPGDQFGGSGSGNNNLVNVSYFSPMYYRVFGEITNDVAFWNSVYKKGYDIMDLAMNANTGLVPDWCTSTGTVPAAGASQYDDKGVNFFYDAVRTPVRIALDYLWYGEQSPRALTYTKKINGWLRTKHSNPADIGAKYSLTGDKLDNSHNNTFVGAFAVSSMATDDASTRAYITSLYNENVKVNPGNGEYFNASWKAISLFILSGNFYLPPPDACDSPQLMETYNLCNGSKVLDGGVTASTYVWKRNGVQVATSQTYTAALPGTYELTTTTTVNGKPCVRRASTEVFQAAPKADFSFVVSGLGATFTDLSLGGVKTYAWTFGANGGTPTNIANPVTIYTAPGLKLVTLTVTNFCDQTNSITKELTVGNPNSTADGWYVSNFTGMFSGNPATWVYTSPSFETKTPAVPTNSIIIVGDCKSAQIAFKTTTSQYSAVSFAFKDPIKQPDDKDPNFNNWPINIKNYPYVRFRMKVDKAIDSLRVDLLDNTYKSTSLKPVYLKGERNANGTYKAIPVGEWFVATLDYTGRFNSYAATNPPVVDAAKIGSINFYPYAQYATATGRKDFNIEIDWIIVGNKQYPAPNLADVASTDTICPVNLGINTIGYLGEICTLDADNISWSTGATTPSIIPTAQGKYTLTVTNFGGVATKEITVVVPQNSKAALSYITPTANSVLVTDASTGPSSGYSWYRVAKSVATIPEVITWGNTTGAGASATLLGTGQTPEAFLGSAFTWATWAEGDRICQRITNPNGCYPTSVTADRGACQTITIVIAGLEDLNATTTNVYPTVVDNQLNIMLGGSLNGTFDVKVSDILGNTHSNLTIGAGLSSINVASLASGTYLVHIKQGDKTITRKFIKQ